METVRVLSDDKQTTDAMENVTSLSFRSGICSWREISDQSESEGRYSALFQRLLSTQ